jgi:GNAT superfamily N-acetyltransferase
MTAELTEGAASSTSATWTADAESAAAALNATWATMCQVAPGGSYVERAGVARARTGIPVPMFNGVWGTASNVDPGEVLNAVAEFAAGELPWNVQLRPGYPGELDEELARRGLTRTAEIPLMVLPDPASLATVLAESPATFRRVESFTDVDSTLSLLERGFGMPPSLSRNAFPLRLLFMADTWLATAGEDVSTGLGMTYGGWCGIFNVATPEEHRGRGYGAAATAQVVEAARAAGARGAYLQSSPMGLPVYQRLGFVTGELWRQWMPTAYVG